MPGPRYHRPRVALLAGAVLVVALVGCGVSGKVDSTDAQQVQTQTSRSPSSTSTTITGLTSTTTEPTSEPTTGEPTTTSTTAPGSDDEFGTEAFKKTYLGILRRAGYTDKEAKCVLAFVTKNGLRTGSTSPTPDLTRILDCLGADQRPGGSD